MEHYEIIITCAKIVFFGTIALVFWIAAKQASI